MLWLDFETRSTCDLKSRGVYNYAQDLTTEVLCMSYAVDDGEVQTWLPGQPLPDLTGHRIMAHNAAFERLICWYVLQVNIPLEQFYCTAAQARANCAPGSLEDAGRFMGASMKKDHRGVALIRKMCVPPYQESAELTAEMIQYCEQDVRAMRAISQAMRPLSDEELADYHVNERINDRGVLVDVPLCRAAVTYAATEAAEIAEIVKEVSAGELVSVRSPKMRQWVWDRVGPEARALMTKDDKVSIDKTVRANLLNCDGVPPDVQEIIQCADDLWASSVAKFARLAQLADVEDSRVRGAFVFAGGSATGRASSYGAQVHNFTRKCAKAPEDVRAAMCRGHAIVPKFGKRVTDVLRGMLRPALIPAKGRQFVVADWSSIEARVNPWLSGTGQAKLDVFESGLDPYIVNASGTFNRTYDDIKAEYDRDGESAQRQIGKVQELACFAAETKVLTNNGVRAITEVQLTDLLWDGQSWVAHQGVISKGVQPTINVCGIEVTPDHLIRTNTTWTQAHQLVSNKQLLIQALETGSANLPFWVQKYEFKALAVSGLYKCNVIAALRRMVSISTTFLRARQHDALFVQKRHPVFGEKIFLSTPMPALMTAIDGGCSIGYRLAKTDATTQKIKAIQTTAAGGYIYLNLGALIKPHFFDMCLPLAVGISRAWSWIGSMSTKVTNRITCALFLSKKTATTNDQFKKCSGTFLNLRPVFDILNSGPRNRFTILTDNGPMIVHNCGFAGGVGAFASMARIYSVRLSEPDSKRMVDAWRRNNQWAVGFWSQLEQQYTRAMRNRGQEFTAGRITYLFDGLHLWYALPSGRVLCYPFARLEDDGISYAKAAWKPAQDATEWPRARLWKGLACENVTQAVANDLLRYALRQLDDVVLHVHDEIVVEGGSEEEVRRVMTTPPAWATGLPLDCGIKTMPRYGK
jgi:hypothetical protein